MEICGNEKTSTSESVRHHKNL